MPQGGTAIYQVYVGNSDPVNATSGTITVTDTGGTGIGSPTFIGGGTPPAWNCAGATCTSPAGYSLGPNSTVYIGMLSATVPPTAFRISNSITISGGGASTITFTTPQSNTTPEPYLAITKTQVSPAYHGNPLPVASGQILTYKLDVDNIGAAPTSGAITVVDTLASDMVVGNVATGGGYWNCSWTVNVVTCTTSNSIPGGKTPGESPSFSEYLRHCCRAWYERKRYGGGNLYWVERRPDHHCKCDVNGGRHDECDVHLKSGQGRSRRRSLS